MIFFLFLLGLAVGSFLNVLIDRLPRDESPLGGRSYCDNCKKKLLWYDLIPVVSFVFLKGKCRYCQSPISWYYPVVELVTGVMFVLTFLSLTSTSEESFGHLRGVTEEALGGGLLYVIYYLFIVSSLIVIFFADLKYGIIPDKIVYPGIVVSLPYLFIIHNSCFIIHLLSALGAFLFFLALFLVTKGRGMGFGDVKLVLLLGLILGFPKIIIAFYFAFLTGAVVGLILIIWGKKRLRGTTVPFGPFLVEGTLLSLFWGDLAIHKLLPFL